MQQIDLDLLVEIAKDVEREDPLNWGRLSVGKDEAFKMIGSSILEKFDKPEYTEEDKIAILAILTNLTVENFLLNLKILEMEKNNEV